MKETWDKTIAGSTEVCARAEDLVAYLYGEAPGTEARAFEKHTEQCASCRAELSAFGNVREAISDWRQQALGTLTSPAMEAKAATMTMPAKEPSAKRLSAFAAIREFFTVSPGWMRAATAVAALVFCALAVIAVAYFAQQPKVVVIEKPAQTAPSKDESKEKVTEMAQNPNDDKPVKSPAPAPQNIIVVQKQSPVAIQANRSKSQVAFKDRRQVLPRRVNAPSAELVRMDDDYLPFTAAKDEEKLPSLADLVSDDN